MSPVEERRSPRHIYVDRQSKTPASHAVMLIGHGSVRSGAGAAMIRLAKRIYQAGVAPIVAAGFLNYRRPTFDEALQRCIQAGASDVIVQPYFLVAGKFVREDLQRMVQA